MWSLTVSIVIDT